MLNKKITFIILLVCLSLSSLIYFSSTRASQLLQASDTMSRLKTGMEANHIIEFTTPTGVAVGQTITIEFPISFNMGLVDWTDIDLKDDGTDLSLAVVATGTTWGVDVTGQVITFTNGTTSVASSSVIEIQIGTNATHQVVGDVQIINPSIEGSQMIRIDGTFGDTATVAVVILDDDQVVVTATINPTLAFSIYALATSTQLGGANSALTDSSKISTTTTLPFGEQTFNQGTVLGQQINVSTNAGNGYQVTLQQNQDLTAGANDIDDYLGTNDSPQKWEDSANPNGSTQNIDTGWFGYTTSDETLSGVSTSTSRFGAGADSADYWAGFTTSSVPHEISFNDSYMIDGETTNIGFKLEVNAYQPSGFYSGTVLTYICTGLF